MPSPNVQHASWVQQTPGVCGGEPCIRETRHTVSGLVQWRSLGLSDAEILQRHPDLGQADLDAAWSYYAKHPEQIDLAIRQNEDA
jgi:uncharacterized protein (DUF433 family)